MRLPSAAYIYASIYDTCDCFLMQDLVSSPKNNPSCLAIDLIFFFLIVYGVSWIFWGTIIWRNLSVAPGQNWLGRSLYVAGIQGPCVAAVAMSWRRGGAAGVWALFCRLIRPACNPIWFVVAIAIVPLIMLAALGLAVLLDHVAMPLTLIVRPVMGWAMLVVGQ